MTWRLGRFYNDVKFALWILREHMRPGWYELHVAAWLRDRGYFVAKLPEHFQTGCGRSERVCFIDIYQAANPRPVPKVKR